MFQIISTGRRAALTLCIVAAPATAGPFDGRYFPWRYTGDDAAIAEHCSGEDLPAADVIIDDQFYYGPGGKYRCTLEAPVNVRDMDAQLYDGQCDGGDREWTMRIFMLKHQNGALEVLAQLPAEDGTLRRRSSYLVPCPAG